MKTKEDLRLDFYHETGDTWINMQGEPDIDYVEWLENKVLSELKSAKEEVKSAEEIFRERTKNIKPDARLFLYSDVVFELMKAYASQFQSVQSKEEKPTASLSDIMLFLEKKGIGSGTNITTRGVAFLIQEFVAQWVLPISHIQSVKGDGERTVISPKEFLNRKGLERDNLIFGGGLYDSLVELLEEYRTQSEGKDMYPKEFIEFLCDYYQKFWDRYILLNGEHVDPFNTKQPFFTFEEVFNHWSSNHK